jgi:thiol-disulfide isomerase/thioredoxin
MVRSSHLIYTVLALVLAGTRVSAQAAAPHAPAPPSIATGDIVPAFDAKTPEGSVRPIRFAKGKVTLLAFFLSGCPKCHRMIPEWNRAFQKKGSDVEIVGVMLDRTPPPPGFLSTLAIEFPIVYMPEGLADKLKIHNVPQTVRVVDGGRVEDFAVGQVDTMRMGELSRPPAPAKAKSAK